MSNMNSSIRIALVGRPNVGKSALFNAICKKRIAIVDEAEGVTRDRLYAKTELFGAAFELIDTGGINEQSKACFQDEIIEQAEIAIREADSIILVVDVTVGLTQLDHEVAKRLHRSKKPLIVAVNKVDNPSRMLHFYDFLALGIQNMIAVSAQHGYQIAELIQQALMPCKEPVVPQDSPHVPAIAIVGRTNAGKSTLLNALAKEKRSIVSPIAATTRDSIDSLVVHGDQKYLFIDTAGIRKKKKEKDVVEKFAYIRTQEAIDRADICLLVIDAQEGMTSDEKRILSMIQQAEKSCIIVINKWDLTKGFRMEHCLKGLEAEISFVQHCPKCIISAKTGRRVADLFSVIDTQLKAHSLRVSTGQLNKFLTRAMQNYHPPVLGGKRLRVYYMTQISTAPPHFVLFVNNPELLDPGYKRYLINGLRETFSFQGVPLTFTLRKREQTRRHGQQRPTPHGSFDRDLPMELDEDLIEEDAV